MLFGCYFKITIHTIDSRKRSRAQRVLVLIPESKREVHILHDELAKKNKLLFFIQKKSLKAVEKALWHYNIHTILLIIAV